MAYSQNLGRELFAVCYVFSVSSKRKEFAMKNKPITGSLQVKDGVYYSVINIYPDGKRKQKWISTGLKVKGNKKRAEKALREEIAKQEQRFGLVSTETQFSAFVEMWLERTRSKIDIITYESYKKLIDIHIVPYFAEKGIKLCDLETEDLQNYFDEKHNKGRKDGNGGLSPCSLRKHKNIINQAIKSAVKKGYLTRNYCEDVEMPSIIKHKARFYTEEQLNYLLESIKDERIYPMVLIASVYGMRRSEICGLQWDSVNFMEKTITVKHTLVKHTTLVAKDTTKTKSSYRTYPLIGKVEKILLHLKEEQKQNKKLYGKQYKRTPYIFTWEDGREITPDYLSHKFSKIIKSKELPEISLHELRHSCASILLSWGFTLKDVQEWLGHADISMTANTYGHLDNKRKQTLANSMTNLIENKC